MKRFENLIIDDYKDGNPDDEYELDCLGQDGWRLSAIQRIGKGTRYYFVREIDITTKSWALPNVFTRLTAI